MYSVYAMYVICVNRFDMRNKWSICTASINARHTIRIGQLWFHETYVQTFKNWFHEKFIVFSNFCLIDNKKLNLIIDQVYLEKTNLFYFWRIKKYISSRNQLNTRLFFLVVDSAQWLYSTNFLWWELWWALNGQK